MFYSRVSLLEKRRLLEWPVWVVVGDPHHPTEAQASLKGLSHFMGDSHQFCNTALSKL